MALNNVPLAGQSLAVTRNPINANFATINAAFLVDHVEYNTAGQGKHNKVTFPVQAATPAFAATEDGLYNKIPAAPFPLTLIPEMFAHKQNFAGAVEVPMTASILSTSNPVVFSSGWTYLPSGIILKWGANQVANGAANIVFPVGGNIPAFNVCFTVIVQVAQGGAGDVNRAIRLVGVNPGNFDVFGSQRTAAVAAATTFTYFAIGY